MAEILPQRRRNCNRRRRNTQPWLFKIANSSIELHIDTQTNVGALDPYLRESKCRNGTRNQKEVSPKDFGCAEPISRAAHVCCFLSFGRSRQARTVISAASHSGCRDNVVSRQRPNRRQSIRARRRKPSNRNAAESESQAAASTQCRLRRPSGKCPSHALAQSAKTNEKY